MIKTFELTWKVSGVLPAPTHKIEKYFRFEVDESYSKRVFGSPELRVRSRPLMPRRQFLEALESEIRDKHQIAIGHNLNQLHVPLKTLGNCPIGLRFRLLGSSVLVLTIHAQEYTRESPVAEVIPLQMLSHHPILESIARFSFNVHYAPSPSTVEVGMFQSKPIIKVKAEADAVRKSDFAALVTRHIGLNDRATQEMLTKNEHLNFNDDLLLVDKQGICFFLATNDSRSQRNRFTRISALCEYALYATTVQKIAIAGSDELMARIDGEIEDINSVVEASWTSPGFIDR